MRSIGLNVLLMNCQRACIVMSLLFTLVCVSVACERAMPTGGVSSGALSGKKAAELSRSHALANRPLPPETEPAIRVRVTSEKLGSMVYTFGSEGQRLYLLERGRNR